MTYYPPKWKKWTDTRTVAEREADRLFFSAVKPCPWCNKTDALRLRYRSRVDCERCRVIGPTASPFAGEDRSREAVELWNAWREPTHA